MTLKDSNEQALEKNPQLQKKLDIIMTEIKAIFAIKHMKTDNIPAEIIPGLYLGSIGAAFSRKNLQDLGITHILCVADQVKEAYPKVIKPALPDLLSLTSTVGHLVLLRILAIKRLPS